MDACPEPIPDPKPIEAMQACDDFLATLPVGFEALLVDEALEVLATNHAVDATFYFQCKRKQEELTRWIEKQ